MTDKSVTQGDCLRIAVIYKVNDAKPAGWPTNFAAELGATWSGGNSLEYDTDNPDDAAAIQIGVDGDDNATITGVFVGSVTAAWPKGKKPITYQLRVRWPDGCVRTLLAGGIEVLYSPIEVAEAAEDESETD